MFSTMGSGIEWEILMTSWFLLPLPLFKLWVAQVVFMLLCIANAVYKNSQRLRLKQLRNFVHLNIKNVWLADTHNISPGRCYFSCVHVVASCASSCSRRTVLPSAHISSGREVHIFDGDMYKANLATSDCRMMGFLHLRVEGLGLLNVGSEPWWQCSITHSMTELQSL